MDFGFINVIKMSGAVGLDVGLYDSRIMDAYGWTLNILDGFTVT